MHNLRFDDIGIYIVQKVVEHCGRLSVKYFLVTNLLRSKKRVTWILKHGTTQHEIFCSISFSSGKKVVVHNGITIQSTSDPSQELNAMLDINGQKMIIMVDRQDQLIRPKVQLKGDSRLTYRQDIFKAFFKFKNIYSD